MAATQSLPTVEPFPVVIVGTGFSGVAMGVMLKHAGIESFTILEKASDIGGTWRDNTYPGAACDIPSHLYSVLDGDPCAQHARLPTGGAATDAERTAQAARPAPRRSRLTDWVHHQAHQDHQAMTIRTRVLVVLVSLVVNSLRLPEIARSTNCGTWSPDSIVARFSPPPCSQR
jgi:cation diffusion facilitator CzcD-associated flavoprotein CzcO